MNAAPPRFSRPRWLRDAIRAIIACVWFGHALAKTVDASDLRSALAVDLPGGAVMAVAATVIAVEWTLVVALSNRTTSQAGLQASGALLVAYTAVLARLAFEHGLVSSCPCGWGVFSVVWVSMARNVVLIALAAIGWRIGSTDTIEPAPMAAA